MNAPELSSVGSLDRRTYIGSSDIAAIMGLSPWMTPLQCYERKIAAEPELLTVERKKFFRRRKRQEPVVAEMLQEEFGIEVTRLSLDDNPNRYIDTEYPFMAAEIDFEFVMSDAVRDCFPDRDDFCAVPNGTLLNGEIKTVHPFKAGEWGEAGSEAVPVHYEAQVQYGLGVTRRPAALVAALFGLDALLAFPMMPDNEAIEGMRSQAARFWTRHVTPRIPPDPINMDDMMRLFAKTNGRPVVADEAMLIDLDNLRRIRGSMSAMEREKEEIEFNIANAIRTQWSLPYDAAPDAGDNAQIIVGGAPFANWNKQSRDSIDSKRLKAERPDIAAEYTRTTWFRSIRFPKQKGAKA